MSIITSIEITMLDEIKKLLWEAYDHYFEFSDRTHKSGEGQISLHFPNRWEDRSPAVEIYSYVFGQRRNHYFDTISDALEQVVIWYEEEMSTDYSEY